MMLISSGLVGEDEVFSKARNNRGETLLLLHQETNPGAVSFSMDGRLTLRIQGRCSMRMILEDMDSFSASLLSRLQ